MTLAVLAIHILVFSSIASAHSDVILDAQGDVAATAPGYVDIVQAKVTEQIGKERLYFKVELAGEVPESPGRFVAYNWNIDAPGGLPFDYAVVIRWCVRGPVTPQFGPGPGHWESFFVNNRAMVATVNAFPFEIDGRIVKAHVSLALLGDPTGFNWNTQTRLAPAASGIPAADIAPDTGLSTFTR